MLFLKKDVITMTCLFAKLNSSAIYKQPKYYAWVYLHCVQK